MLGWTRNTACPVSQTPSAKTTLGSVYFLVPYSPSIFLFFVPHSLANKSIFLSPTPRHHLQFSGSRKRDCPLHEEFVSPKLSSSVIVNTGLRLEFSSSSFSFSIIIFYYFLSFKKFFNVNKASNTPQRTHCLFKHQGLSCAMSISRSGHVSRALKPQV